MNKSAFEFESRTATDAGVMVLPGIDVFTVNSDLLIEDLVSYYDSNDNHHE
ncbi:hypothetical protein ACIQM3_17595 [Streptomyces sp. NPDC091271]|uniref:hypothetical protein n=1 Tax=Streptomyces sp. NPDC091271 TaxID=3365980 RepID=UPI003803706B